MIQKEVEILFSTPKKWHLSGQIIKWTLGAKFSHVCLKINSEFYERVMVYEASAGQVQAENYDNWLKRNKVLSRFDVTVSSERKKKMIQFCIDHLRFKYGFWSLIGIFFNDKFGIRLPLGIDGAKKFICSEFTYLCLKDEILEIAKSKQIEVDQIEDYIDPTEVYKILASKVPDKKLKLA